MDEREERGAGRRIRIRIIDGKENTKKRKDEKRSIITIDSNSISIFFYQLYFSNYIYTLTRKLISTKRCSDVLVVWNMNDEEKTRKKIFKREKLGERRFCETKKADTRHWMKGESSRAESSEARVALRDDYNALRRSFSRKRIGLFFFYS